MHEYACQPGTWDASVATDRLDGRNPHVNHASITQMESSQVAPKSKIDTVANLAKRRGLVYPCGEIYGGTKSPGTTVRSAWN